MRFEYARRALLAPTLLLSALCTPAAAQQGPQLRREIAASLVQLEAGQLQAMGWAREPDVIVLYFGAGWCSACHALTPELIKLRNALRTAGSNTEVVFVSQDESRAQMHRHMRNQAMPWPALDYRRIKRLPALHRLAGLAPPNLVLLDHDGTVLANGWNGHRYPGPAAVMDCWLHLEYLCSTPESPSRARSGPAMCSKNP